ncbi:MAG TPA: hypothetical protein VM406_14125 [Noviherbaspirillum sp.]|nr:hypothetical protein [Noviherbaspirillum sp.]
MSDLRNDYDDRPDSPSLRPWIPLQSTYDVEAWIDSYNRELQRAAGKANAAGYGICFQLSHGGELYMHTTPEGEVLLDVTHEAQWVAPLIAAAAQVPEPAGRIWSIPADRMTQLIFGLSSLIDASRIVLAHDFRRKK